MTATQEQTAVEVVVADDHMKAWLHCIKDADLTTINQEVVKSILTSARIALSDDVVTRIGDFLKSLASNATLPDRFLIAEGREPTEPQDERFEWSPETAKPVSKLGEGAGVGFRPSNIFRRVQKNAVVGRVFPPTKGTAGRNVHDDTIEPTHSASAIEVGPNVKVLEDGSVVSEADGKAVFQNERISVEEILDVSGDVDPECGNLDKPCDIHIRGLIHDSLEVKSTRTITVDGRIGAAQVTAGMDIVVHKGIIGGHEGKVSAGGTIATQFCEKAKLEARGDIRISSRAVNSKLVTDGKLLADRAKITGGMISARKGAVVSILGDDAEAPTSVIVGTHAKTKTVPVPDVSNEVIAGLRQERLESDSREIQKLEDTAAKIRQYLRLAIDQPEKISDARRQRAVELLTQADNIEAGVQHKIKISEKLAKTGELLGTADIVINKAAHPKVTLMVDDHKCHLTKRLNGPVRIEKRKLKNVSELIAVNLQTGSYTQLQSERLAPLGPSKSGRESDRP